MNSQRILRQAVRTALFGSGAITASMALHSSLAQAQTAPAAKEAGEAVLQEVVVTGSRISSPNLEAISPVTAVTAEEIRDTGTTRIEDVLNSLPQVVADQNSGLSMGTSGVANIDLRGLGVARTLVLINGRRVIGGDPTGGGASIVNLEGASAADVNQIPVALIERVDVLTGGASSTYGADAVAGVVNFIMNTHFDGVRIDANVGVYNHDNHQDWLSPVFQASGFAPVTGSNWDGANKNLTIILGSSFADGRGHFEGYLGYQRSNPVAASHRDHSACGLSFTGSPVVYSCAGSSNTAPTLIKTADLSTSSQVNATGDLVPQYNHFNFANYFYLQRIDERYNAGFFGNLKMNEHAEAYTEFMFMDDETRGNYGPAGLFSGSGFSVTPPGNPGAGLRNGAWTINCGLGAYGNSGMNPYLTQNEYNALCTPGNAYAQNADANGHTLPNGDIQVVMARRNVEGGPREDTFTHTTWRGVLGLKGEISADWNYDTSLTYSVVRLTDYHNNDTSSRLMQDAMLAVKDPATGQIVCRSGASGCIPWNIFNPAGPNAVLAVPYFSVPGLLQGAGSEQIWTTFVDGDLTHAGVKLPTADDGLKLVLGTEYRQESISFSPDAELIQGDLAGIGSPTIGYQTGFHVWEGFTEARLPLVRNMTGFQVLDLEGGYRYSSYTSGFNTDTYKVGLTWAPVKDVRLRASYNKAVRAPNAAELGKPTYVALDGGADLCAKGTTFSAAQCAQTGLLASQYPAAKSPAAQYNGQIGGNPNLQPETGKTKAVGIVFTPTFLPSFSASVDYSDIKITDVVSSYGSSFIQAECIATGSPFWCSSNPAAYQPGIHRNAVGSLWSNPDGYVIDPLVNTGSEENKSVDVGLGYRQSIGRAGQLRARFDGTELLHLYFTPGGPNPATYDCAGHFGNSCSPATPKWRHRFSMDWDTPLQGLGFGATWRYYSEVTNTTNTAGTPDYIPDFPNPDTRLPSMSYIDLRASYVFGKATLRLGCNNVADKDPSVVTLFTAGNGTQASANTYPGVYDTSGRYLYANLTVDF
ncbi:MAG TPA: TonB-dependent receptor [Steroidobacteraceae bacterium]|nr:TonB-dependent receptor [Steroidobacteraceae bacterium]